MPETESEWAEHLRATGAMGTPDRVNWPWVSIEVGFVLGVVWGLRRGWKWARRWAA